MLPRDAHTHRPATDALVDIDPTVSPTLPDGLVCSAGIHPWRAAEAGTEATDRLAVWASDPRVIAIGETGLDRNYPDPGRQLELLRLHISLSEKTAKPLVLHVVRAFGQVIDLHDTIKPRQPWIIHGFRGKPELARQLVRAGFYISFGPKFNPESLRAVPAERRLAETDDSTLTIEEVEALHRETMES